MPFFGPRVAYGEAGSLRLSVNYIGPAADEGGGWRSRFLYRVDGPPTSYPSTFIGSDLYSRVSSETTAREMLQSLASFLANAGERYASHMAAPDAEYPEWVYEAAYVNSEELGLLAEGADEPGETPAIRVEYVSIVFLQGDEAEEALELLESDAPPAAIEYLSQWDYGEETEMAARANGHVYPEPPASAHDMTWAEDEYVLSWSMPFGTVGLSRRVEVPVSPTATAAPPSRDADRHMGPATPLSTSRTSADREPPSR
jgi:hypothetical protein